MKFEQNWKPIAIFVNGSYADAIQPPEYTIAVGGIIEIRGRCRAGIEGYPCCRLPEEDRPEQTFRSAKWWGFEHENYRSVKIDPDGYVTIIETSRQALLDFYLASLA